MAHEIKETTSSLGFVRPVQFMRTGRLRDRLVDCSREELIDLNFHYLELLEKAQGIVQNLSDSMEESLGWSTGPGL